MECMKSKHSLNNIEVKKWKVQNMLFAEGYTIKDNRKIPVIICTDLKAGGIREATETEISMYCIPGNEVESMHDTEL